MGTDVNYDLLKFAKNKNKNKKIKIKYDDITRHNKQKLKADIIHSAGVLNIFDNVENTINQLISRCNRGGHIYIIHYFNEHDVDYIVRYRDNINSKEKEINEMGWNVFSKQSISRILKKIKKVAKFRFIEVKYPQTISVKRDKKDPMRSWTAYYNKSKYFVNGLNFLNKIYFLEIKLK